MSKLIEKILDKYFAKKFMDKLQEELLIFYIDRKVTYSKKYARLQIKNRKYNDEHYVTILTIYYPYSFDMYWTRYDKIVEEIKFYIKNGGLK